MSTEVTDDVIRRCKELEVIISEHLVDFCKENDIPIFLAWGSLLGAVRHGGFIPWDDDMDFAMLRSDYERFIELYSKSEQGPFCLESFEVNRKSPYLYAKICLAQTSFVTSDTTGENTNPGVSVDIFPLDNIPEDSKALKAMYRRTQFWRMLFISSVMWKAGNLQSTYKRYIFTAIRVLLHVTLLPIPREYLYSKYLQAAKSYENTETKFLSDTDEDGSVKILREDLFPQVNLKFEQTEFPAMANYVNWLEASYGDYMRLPPKNRRFGHRPLAISLGPWECKDPRL